jgi:hypothetical protein
VINGHTTFGKAVLASPVVAALLALGSVTAPAYAAHDYRWNDLRTRVLYHGNTTVLSYAVVQRHDKQSHATIQRAGHFGAQAEAKCKRRNGGTRWYRSTIRVTKLHRDSHYDCDNNGTYNRAIVGLGVYLS